MPIQLAYMDYANKRAGLGPLMSSDGRYREADMVDHQSLLRALHGQARAQDLRALSDPRMRPIAREALAFRQGRLT